MTTETVNGAMIRSITIVDRMAVGLSLLCLVHCLIMPLLLIALPSLAVSMFASESVHLWLIYAVVPSSLFALGMGCRQHRRGQFILIGLAGLSLLILGILVEQLGWDDALEQVFTAAGATLIAFAHVLNFRACGKSADCVCH